MKKYFLAALLATCLFSCKKKDAFTSPAISDYYPLTPGKYIIYNLDSMVLPPFGSNFVIHHYEAMDSIDAQITDNLGRPAYRILRSLRADSTQPWIPDNTFVAVETDSTMEYTEDNLRFLKLVAPIVNGFSWNGNSHLTSDPYPSYQFNSDFMADWQYMYQMVGQPATVGANTFSNTITVFERADSTGTPVVVNVTPYAEATNSEEVYAKGIGLIYRNFMHWEYQPSRGYIGFGITLAIKDHN